MDDLFVKLNKIFYVLNEYSCIKNIYGFIIKRPALKKKKLDFIHTINLI